MRGFLRQIFTPTRVLLAIFLSFMVSLCFPVFYVNEKSNSDADAQCLDGQVPPVTSANNCSFRTIASTKLQQGDAQVAQEVASRMKAMYLRQVQRQLANGNTCKKPQVIEYNCANTKFLCGGFGDRSRGLVSMFYTALMTNSIFHVNWTIPVDLGLYFRQNADLYQVPAGDFEQAVSPRKTSYSSLMDSPNENYLYVLASRGVNSMEVDKMAVATNSLMGVSGAFSNKRTRANLCRYVGDVDPERFHVGVAVSAALRVLFSEPTDALAREVDRVIALQADAWSSSTKIGVQVRMENAEWYEHARVGLQQVPCFVEEVKRLVASLEIERPLVYVTSDNSRATEALSRLFNEAHVAVFSDTVHSEPLHIDRQQRSGTGKERLWAMHVRSFVDWWLLTKMDYLLISRSGFAEAAQMYSLAPARRFVHQKFDNGQLTYNDVCTFEAYSVPNALRMEFNIYNGPLA